MRDPLSPALRAKVDEAAAQVVAYVLRGEPVWRGKPRNPNQPMALRHSEPRPASARALMIRDRLQAGETGADIARSLGVSRAAVYQMRDRLTARGLLGNL